MQASHHASTTGGLHPVNVCRASRTNTLHDNIEVFIKQGTLTADSIRAL